MTVSGAGRSLSVGGRELLLRPRCMRVSVSGSVYGLPLDQVQEVIAQKAITRVFHAPLALAGIMNLRGEVLPVLELRVLLGIDDAVSQGPEARVVVVRELSGARRRAGVKVDELLGLIELPEHGLLPLPPSISAGSRAFIAGVISAVPPCSVVDVPALLGAPALSALASSQGL